MKKLMNSLQNMLSVAEFVAGRASALITLVIT